MIIMGIDPGLATCGYGFIESKGNKQNCLASGILKTSTEQTSTERLDSIYRGINSLIKEFSPETVGVENLFFSRNTKTAFQVGQAKGVIMLACAHNGLEVYEYTPLQVKHGVCGDGSATKSQVKTMVSKILNLSSPPYYNDAADALAICLCHNQAYKMKQKMKF